MYTESLADTVVEKMPIARHQCRMDTMLARELTHSRSSQQQLCYRNRLRQGHHKFRGKYAMCRKAGCISNERLGCRYAHSEIERELWNLEKTGIFDIWNYIRTNRDSTLPLCSSAEDILAVYPVSSSTRFGCVGSFTNTC